MFMKHLLLMFGGFTVVMGVVFLLLPVPVGLPTMAAGLSIVFRTAPRSKRFVIALFKKTRQSWRFWRWLRSFKRRLAKKNRRDATFPDQR